MFSILRALMKKRDIVYRFFYFRCSECGSTVMVEREKIGKIKSVYPNGELKEAMYSCPNCNVTKFITFNRE